MLALEALAVECGATMFMLLLGALQLLLCAHGATDDVVVRQCPSATMFALLSPPSLHAHVDRLQKPRVQSSVKSFGRWPCDDESSFCQVDSQLVDRVHLLQKMLRTKACAKLCIE